MFNNNNTQIAAVALPPSTTHPLPLAEQHTHAHTYTVESKKSFRFERKLLSVPFGYVSFRSVLYSVCGIQFIMLVF